MRVDLIQMDDYPADHCAISPTTFLLNTITLIYATRAEITASSPTQPRGKTNCRPKVMKVDDYRVTMSEKGKK